MDAKSPGSIDTSVAGTTQTFAKVLAGVGSATTEVSTDPRVFERITLGLYREPSAAIRELISNAYDADANVVTITTNAPYFDRIQINDDGNGISPAAIEQIVHHVGGSLKHVSGGFKAGVTRSAGFSPAGRKLIGQMGIGLYSVARLTRQFTIETKQKDDQFRIVLQFDLSGLDISNMQPEGAEKYVAGHVEVRRERTHPSEYKFHYTRIELRNILGEAQSILQSADRWNARASQKVQRTKGELEYHIGRAGIVSVPPQVPWKNETQPERKFAALVNALSTRSEASAKSPSLDQTLDYYLAMLWRISLSAPLRYVERHPFSLTSADGIDFYSLADDNTPDLIDLPAGVTIGAYLNVAEKSSSPTEFRVIVDDVELKRPIVFRPFSIDNHKLLSKPKMFVGQIHGTADGLELSGTGYFFWSYAIVPKENNGLLTRISGASGTLFDREFLDFRTSESVRLRQISSEAFINSGLAAALNVDRESFVDSDADYRALQRWTHRSMTRIFTRLKGDQRAHGATRKFEDEAEESQRIAQAARRIWSARRGSRSQKPPEIIIASRDEPALSIAPNDIFVGGIPSAKRGGLEQESIFKARLEAIVLILDSWSLLDELDAEERSNLLQDFAKIIERS